MDRQAVFAGLGPANFAADPGDRRSVVLENPFCPDPSVETGLPGVLGKTNGGVRTARGDILLPGPLYGAGGNRWHRELSRCSRGDRTGWPGSDLLDVDLRSVGHGGEICGSHPGGTFSP